MSLFVEDLFWQVLVFFTNGCSADSYDFNMLMRGGELRVYLLHHLGHSQDQEYITNIVYNMGQIQNNYVGYKKQGKKQYML